MRKPRLPAPFIAATGQESSQGGQVTVIQGVVVHCGELEHDFDGDCAVLVGREIREKHRTDDVVGPGLQLGGAQIAALPFQELDRDLADGGWGSGGIQPGVRRHHRVTGVTQLSGIHHTKSCLKASHRGLCSLSLAGRAALSSQDSGPLKFAL